MIFQEAKGINKHYSIQKGKEKKGEYTTEKTNRK